MARRRAVRSTAQQRSRSFNGRDQCRYRHQLGHCPESDGRATVLSFQNTKKNTEPARAPRRRLVSSKADCVLKRTFLVDYWRIIRPMCLSEAFRSKGRALRKTVLLRRRRARARAGRRRAAWSGAHSAAAPLCRLCRRRRRRRRRLRGRRRDPRLRRSGRSRALTGLRAACSCSGPGRGASPGAPASSCLSVVERTWKRSSPPPERHTAQALAAPLGHAHAPPESLLCKSRSERRFSKKSPFSGWRVLISGLTCGCSRSSARVRAASLVFSTRDAARA